MARGAPFSGNYRDVWCEEFGASPSASASANTAMINAAIVFANAHGRPLRIGPGEFKIDDTLLFNECSLTWLGAGQRLGLGGVGTVLDWYGANDRAAVEFLNSRACRIQGMTIRATSTSRRLLAGVDFRRSAGGAISHRNVLQNVWIDGFDGHLAHGVRIYKDADATDANNSEHEFHDVVITNYSSWSGAYPESAAITVTQAQAVAHTYNRVAWVAHNGAQGPGKYGYRGHSSGFFRDCGGGNNEEADFRIIAPNGPLIISGGMSEHSKRFILAPIPIPIPISVEGYRWSTPGAVAADNIIVDVNANLTMESCRIDRGGYGGGGIDMFVRVSGTRFCSATIRQVTIESDAYPFIINTGAGRYSYDFVGNSRIGAGGIPETLPDHILHAELSVESSLATQSNSTPSGYLRPAAPGDGTTFFDKHLGTLITWDADAGAWMAGGAVAGAEWTPSDGGTLVAAWHFDSGVTQSGGIVSSVTGKFGTSVALAQAVAGDRPTLLTKTLNGHALVQGSDGADFLEAVLAGNLVQPCAVYATGIWGDGDPDTELFGCGNGNIVGKRAAPFGAGLYSGATLATVNGTPAANSPFSGAWTFNGGASSVLVRQDVGPPFHASGPGNGGTNDGNTVFRVGKAAGTGQRAAFSLVLVYSAVTDAAAIKSYCDAWSAVS